MSNEIKRYRVDGRIEEIDATVFGGVILFTDHKASIAAKDAEIAQFRHIASGWQQKATQWSRENADLRNKCQSIAEQVRKRCATICEQWLDAENAKDAIRTADLTDLLGHPK